MQELSGVSEVVRELAMSRFRLIQPHLEKSRPLQLVAADGKLPFRTAQRWVSQYRKFGLIALVRKSRDDRGARRVVSPKIKAAVTLHSIRGLTPLIFQHCPLFHCKVIALK
jgi:putative transposase